MSHPLRAFERPQVKGILPTPTGPYLATEIGLYQLKAGQLHDIIAWRGQPVQHIATAPGGYLVLLEDDSGQTLHLCDAQWQIRRELPLPPGEKIKCLHCQDENLLAGTKHGLFRLALSSESATEKVQWQCLFRDRNGWGEVLWIHSDNAEHIRASVKKLGADAKPALIETHDNGTSWHVESVADYQDLILAADTRHWISRWKGYRGRRATSGHKKHPLTAGYLGGDCWAVLEGNKLEYQRQGQARVAFKHPLLAEAERLYPIEQGHAFLVAGVQGAYLVEPGQGRVTDLFADHVLTTGLGKLKRIFELDDGVLLAIATYGTFRSEDAGRSWQPVDSEWTVLDAEHLVRSGDGRWWLGCQRALFVSADNGRRWRHVKLKLKELPHYAELRGGLAIVGERLFIGSKTGLLVCRLEDPECVSRVAAFGVQAIEALFTDRRGKHLIVGTHAAGHDRLWHYRPNKQKLRALTAPGQVPVFESELGGNLHHFLIATGERLFSVFDRKNAGVEVREITPRINDGEYHITSDSRSQVLVWNARAAWLWHVGEKPPKILSDWPAGVRHAWLCDNGCAALTTDRRQLRVVALNDTDPTVD